jgi:hypothetical protein
MKGGITANILGLQGLSVAGPVPDHEFPLPTR